MPKAFYLDMPIEEAMSTQRTIRRLKPDPVEDGLVLHLIDLATKAPVGSNAQKWEFIVIRDPAIKAALGELNRRAVSLYLGWGQKLASPAQRMVDSVRWQMEHFHEIPVVVVACYRGRPAPFPFVAQTSFYGSIYPAIQNLLLGARAAGLGAALITLPLWSPSRVRRLLGLPGSVTPCAVIPMGWPVGKYGPTPRKPVGDVVHVDTYGHQPYREAPQVLPVGSGDRRTVGAFVVGAAIGVGLLAWWKRSR